MVLQPPPLTEAQVKKITLTFNHPVKALFWTGLTFGGKKPTWKNGVQAGANTGVASYTAKLQLNGHDRAQEQGDIYFTGVQPYECGLRPCYTTVDDLNPHKAGMYSFCLKPAEHQPSEHATSQELIMLD